MYRAGTNVSDAQKALKIKGFPGFVRDWGSFTLIVNGKNLER